MIVVADTSWLLAVQDEDDADHQACRKVLAQASLLVRSPLVIAELDYLSATKFGEDMAIKVNDHIVAQEAKGHYEIPPVTGRILAASRVVRLRYRALEVGVTDAVNVVLSAEYDTDSILTLDRRHFRAMRPATGRYRGFKVLPDDL